MRIWRGIKRITEKYSRSLLALAGVFLLTGFLMIVGRNLLMFWFLNENKLDILCQDYVVSFKSVYSPIHYWQRFAGAWLKNADDFQLHENRVLEIVKENSYFQEVSLADPATLYAVPAPGEVFWDDVVIVDGKPFLSLVYCFKGNEGSRYVTMKLPFDKVVVSDHAIRGFAVVEDSKNRGMITAISTADWHNYDTLYEPYEADILRMNAEKLPVKRVSLGGTYFRPVNRTFTIEDTEFYVTLYFNEDTVSASVDVAFLIITILLPFIGFLIIVFVVIPKIQGRYFTGDSQVLRIISAGESELLEFKSSLRWDYVQNTLNKELENVIIKSIAAFTNAKGGRLIIGVRDDGAILGLENDFLSLKEQSADYFELHLRNLIDTFFGRDFSARQVRCRFYTFTEKSNMAKQIVLVDISESDEPVYITLPQQGAKTEKFFVRSGNSSRALESLSEINRYIKKRF